MLKTTPSTQNTLLCPSAQPTVKGGRVLGVVQQLGDGFEVSYLDQPLPVTSEILAMAAPAQPTEVFRLAAPYQTHHCPHYDGADCSLVTRIVQIMPAVVDQLPRCQIRSECRWFHQEGAAACRRCPQVSTVNYDASETMQSVVNLPPVNMPMGNETRRGKGRSA